MEHCKFQLNRWKRTLFGVGSHAGRAIFINFGQFMPCVITYSSSLPLLSCFVFINLIYVWENDWELKVMVSRLGQMHET